MPRASHLRRGTESVAVNSAASSCFGEIPKHALAFTVPHYCLGIGWSTAPFTMDHPKGAPVLALKVLSPWTPLSLGQIWTVGCVRN